MNNVYEIAKDRLLKKLRKPLNQEKEVCLG